MGESPVFDEEWVRAARYAEADRRAAAPASAPQPWRAWTPAPPRPRRLRGVLIVLAVVALAVLGSLALRAHDSARPEVRASSAPTSSAPSSAAPVSAAPLLWAPATAMPDGLDAGRPEVFATLKVGACLAEPADLRSSPVVPCSGPHTDEVDLVRDLTAEFPTTPTTQQIAALNDRLCPAAARAWTGGADVRYTSGYLWQFENGVPGRAVRGFACTAQLSGHSPFTGTLRRAAA